MAVNVTVTRSSTLFNDQDGDGVFDPGDVIITRIRIANSGSDPATNVTAEDTLNGVTLVAGSVQVTPIAYDDAFSLTGNTPITINAAQGLLLNDVDPDGAGGNIGLTVTGVDTTGTQGTVAFNANGSFTFTPTTGFVGITSFKYYVQDAQGLGNVTEGIVTMTVTDKVWYVDNTYGGENGASDGSYMKPFTSLTPLNNNGVDADGIGDTIFVYNNGGNYTAGITLEAGQKLLGDGVGFMVNGRNIGGTERTGGVDNVSANAVISLTTGTVITLATDNIVRGLTIDSNGAAVVGMADGNGSVTTSTGTLTVNSVSFTGSGQAIDIDQGGNLAITIDSLTSTGSAGQGVQLAGTASSGTGLITGNVIITAGTIGGATGILLGAAGGGTANSGGNVNLTYGGVINGTTGTAVEIQDRTGGTATFNGNITHNGTTGNGIVIDSLGSGTVNFNGQSTSITTTTGIGVNLTNNTGGTINFTPAGGGNGFDVSTGAGKGLVFTGGGTLSVTGAGNSVATTTGQILDLQNGTMGTSGIQFATLGSGTVATGNAININNLDAAGAGTFQGGAVTIVGASGASADGINITSSDSTFSFTSATIGGGAAGTNPIAGDGIEINGQTQTQGAVTFSTVNVNGTGGVGVHIAGATNAVNISAGSIGATNDPANDGVRINGGTGAVTVAAHVTQSSGGNQVVDITGHSGGTITFSGNVTAGNGGGGISLTNNTGGAINFTGDVSLTTGTLAALTFTNNAATGANVTLSGGASDITTTSGTGINATSTTVGAGSLTISGAANTVATATGRAINVDGVTANLTLLSVAVSGGGTTTGVFLKNTGAGGQFVVTGTASNAGTGGTIANITGADVGTSTGAATTGTGMYLENVSNVSLSNMIFGSTVAGQNLMSNFGIRGENVNNFTLRDSEFRGTFGTNEGQDEGTIRFGTENNTSVTGLRGTALFEGNNIAGGYENNLSVFLYGANTLNMTVRDSVSDQAVFGLNGSTVGDDSLHVESGGTSNLTLTVTGVAFNGARGDQLQTIAIGNTTQTISITNNQFLNGHGNIVSGGGGVTLLGGDTAASSNVNITYDFSNNVIKGAKGDALRAIYTGTAGTISGVIANNLIGTDNGVLDLNANGGSIAGGTGINAGLVRSAGTGSLTYALRIEGNTIRDIQNAFGGIILTSNMAGTTGTARLEATVKNNTVKEVGGDVLAGLYAIVGGQSSAAVSNDAAKMGLVITGNTFTAGQATGGAAILLDQLSANAQYYIPGYTVNANTNHGEFRPSGGGGTASTSLSNFWKAPAPANNTLINGPFPTIAGASVDANQTTNIGNNAFVLAVPMLAAPQAGLGWEDLVEKVVAPTPDTGGETGSGTTDSGGGDMGSGGAADAGGSGGTSGTGDTGSDGGGSGTPAPIVVDDGVVSAAELDLLVEAAIQRWIDAGATAAQVDAMRAVKVGIIDMAGIYVGASSHGIINIDDDAAGRGWFVDSTPGEDSEFAGSGTRLTAHEGGAAAGKLDLLTVLMHELGHQIGLGDEYQTGASSELMYGYINVGERRLPADGEAAGAVPGSVGSTAYALTPVNVGTLPAGKTVDVYFKSTIDSQTDGFIVNLNNDSTIKGDNFSNVVANEQNVLDSLTLGSHVFVDANLNGTFDSGEGRSGVALQLYADTNDSGGWDAGDALLGSTTTGAGGVYSFAGLAPGDYIVVVSATNFGSGGALEDLLIVQGTATDPDDNVDHDNNGVAATGGAVASKTITLAYNTEPTNGTGNDTNNTLDFGFVANQPPVANDDGVTVGEDSGANDLTSQLLANDTDPENDTRTITSATQGTNGTTSVVAGVLTYTPNGNFNGTDTFTYTIDDGQGHTDTATVTVTVSAVNDAVTGTVPATASLNEDSANVAISGMSISDVDAALAPAGVYEATLSATNGTLTMTTLTGLTFTAGDGTGDSTMTFHGTLAAINTALATAQYTPASNFNGAATITLNVTDTFGGTVATGTGAATNDSDVINVTVNSVNDEPAGSDASAAPLEGVAYTFLTADFSGGFSDPVDGDDFAGVKITTLPGTGTIKLNGVAISAGAMVTKTQLDAGELTYDSAAGSAGTSPTFTFQVQDDGTTANGGVDLDQTPNTFTLDIGVSNFAPAIDLDGDDSNSPGTGFASAYTEGGSAAAIADTDVLITDADGDDLAGATITVTNAVAGDTLTVVGALPGSIAVDPTSTATTIKLTGTGTAAEYAAAIEQITFSSTSDDPTAGGTNVSRTITVTVSDGVANSAPATATVSVTDVNDAPTGTSATITAVEDSFRLLSAADFGFVDADGTFASVTISGVTGGGIYVDADGSAGPGGFALETLPKTYSAQDLIDGKVAFRAGQDANGAAIGTITFAVTDDDGATDPSPETLTVDVTAVNDAPVLTTGGPIAATEQTAVAILPAGSVADVDLDARNGGDGDYAGSTFSVNRNPATNTTEDVFTLVAGPSFTIDGSNLKSGGLIFGTINVDGSAGLIVINFTSLETTATSALVDEVIQSVRYTNTSDNPPASVDLAVGFTDGAPGGGQGTVISGNNLDVNVVTVTIAAVNDAPVNSLGGTIGTGEDAVDAWLSGMSISDPDADPATDEMYITFQVLSGGLEIRTDVSGGIVAGDIIAEAADGSVITVLATLNKINATLAASNGLTYTPTANFNGDDTLTVYTNDQGANGSDPGLTGDGTSEEGVATRTISVSASPDAPIAQPDAVSTPENVVGTGSLFANNGSGPDTDADGDPITVSHVNGSPVVDGQAIVLASGAILIVNADGSYSYDPNGKFNTLTDNSSGAVNTSTVGDTFEYTVTGGNTVTVTVTVNGVAGPGDHLAGDGTDNTITGTPQNDQFRLQQGGNDTVYGLAGDDVFYFGAAFTGDDIVDGGSGERDAIVLQGNYTLTLSETNIAGVESISLQSGGVTRWGDTANNFYDYNLTMADGNVAAGQQLIVNGQSLRAGEDFTFDGSAETDGRFLIFGGRGVDTLTGGAGNDLFVFEGDRWGASDRVDGGAGRDSVMITAGNGLTHIEFGANSLTGIEALSVNNRYSSDPTAKPSYEFVLHNGNVAPGAMLIVNGSSLSDPTQTFSVDGTAVQNGHLTLFGGAGNDVLTGGAGNDILFGGNSGDTLRGNGGNDIFRYDSISESNPTERDGIQDFTLGDLIDLSRIDADTNQAGDQAFTFIGSAAFSGQAGELRFENISLGGPVWMVQGDTDGNGGADFEIVVVIADADPITAGDFIL